MKVTIEIYQSKFNDEWHCDVKTSEGGKDVHEYWAVENFCALLKLLGKIIDSAKLIGEKNENE